MPSVLTERQRHGSTTLGVVLIVIGAIALLAPFFAALFVIRVLMWLLVFAAIEQVIYAFQTRSEGGLFLKIALAVLYAVAGGLLLSRPVGGAIAVTAVIDFLLIADGIAEIAPGVQLRRTYNPRIGWLFAGGILSVVLGGLIVFGRPRSVMAVGMLLGIRLTFKGIEHIVRSSMSVKTEHIVDRKAA
jgi:uncharacterized membrane protein HdeD (DUF308 family)